MSSLGIRVQFVQSIALDLERYNGVGSRAECNGGPLPPEKTPKVDNSTTIDKSAVYFISFIEQSSPLELSSSLPPWWEMRP